MYVSRRRQAAKSAGRRCRACRRLPARRAAPSACSSCQRATAARSDVAVVAAAQSAIGGEHQQHGLLGLLAALQQRMADFQAAVGQVGHQLRDPLGVGRGRVGPIHRLLEARRGDQLHRPRDLADVADRLAAFVEGAGFGHGGSDRRAEVTMRRMRSSCRFASGYLRLVVSPAVLGACLRGELLLELADRRFDQRRSWSSSSRSLVSAIFLRICGFWSCMNVRKSFSQVGHLARARPCPR